MPPAGGSPAALPTDTGATPFAVLTVSIRKPCTPSGLAAQNNGLVRLMICVSNAPPTIWTITCGPVLGSEPGTVSGGPTVTWTSIGVPGPIGSPLVPSIRKSANAIPRAAGA